MRIRSRDSGAAGGRFGKAIGGVFLLVFIAAAIGMGTMVSKAGAPWPFGIVPWGMALIGVMLLIRLAFLRDSGAVTPVSLQPSPEVSPVAPRTCAYCGRLTAGSETLCLGCGGRVG